MDIPNLANLLMNNGMCIVIVAYFLYKDWKLSSNLNDTLAVVREFLSNNKEMINNDIKTN